MASEIIRESFRALVQLPKIERSTTVACHCQRFRPKAGMPFKLLVDASIGGIRRGGLIPVSDDLSDLRCYSEHRHSVHTRAIRLPKQPFEQGLKMSHHALDGRRVKKIRPCIQAGRTIVPLDSEIPGEGQSAGCSKLYRQSLNLQTVEL